MGINERIEYYIEALVRERTVASSTRIATPLIIKTVDVDAMRQVVDVPTTLKLDASTKAAIRRYKEDDYLDINSLLRQYQGRLDAVSDVYGTGSSYELVTDVVASLHDALLAVQKRRGTPTEIHFGPLAWALEQFFEDFPWTPLEVQPDATVRKDMADRAKKVVRLLQDWRYDVDYSDLPDTIIRNTKDFFRSKWYSTLIKRFDALRKHLRQRDAHDMSYDLRSATGTCRVSRDVVVYRAGHPAEFVVPKTRAGAKAAVGKIVSSNKFLSTSLSLSKASNFLQDGATVIYVITIPKGLHALPVELVCRQLKIEVYMNEMEMLFAPGHKIRIDRIEHDADPEIRQSRVMRTMTNGTPLNLNPAWGDTSDQYLNHYPYNMKEAQYIVYATLIDDGVSA